MSKAKSLEEQFVLMHNIEQKRIFHSQIRLLQLMKTMLKRLQVHQVSMTKANFTIYPEIEGELDTEEKKESAFRMRMSLRVYFKDLKMHMERIRKGQKLEKKTFKEDKEEKKVSP